LELLHDVLVGSLVIAIVAYTTSYSMARIFARRRNYEIDANQELLALVSLVTFHKSYANS
jgi:MFS superfamily sulfate permease-like transporter